MRLIINFLIFVLKFCAATIGILVALGLLAILIIIVRETAWLVHEKVKKQLEDDKEDKNHDNVSI
jgi:hypothetical protein